MEGNQDDYPVPMARVLFSGPRAPLARALAWCGWHAYPVDMKLDGTDISDKSAQDGLYDSADNYCFHWLAIPSSSFAKAKGKQVDGQSSSHRLFRSDILPRGFPDVIAAGAASRDELTQANELADFEEMQ